jgi:hypothetical protein
MKTAWSSGLHPILESSLFALTLTLALALALALTLP